jgi:hypothetical protein
VDARKINSALAEITAEQDPTLKSAKLASLCSALWAERGVELVVVGGSAIEILPEYRNVPECQKLVKEVADELKVQSPLHSD